MLFSPPTGVTFTARSRRSPLLADGVARNGLAESTNYHGVPADLFGLHTQPKRPARSCRRQQVTR
jgi:hypothetical protein